MFSLVESWVFLSYLRRFNNLIIQPQQWGWTTWILEHICTNCTSIVMDKHCSINACIPTHSCTDFPACRHIPSHNEFKLRLRPNQELLFVSPWSIFTHFFFVLYSSAFVFKHLNNLPHRALCSRLAQIWHKVQDPSWVHQLLNKWDASMLSHCSLLFACVLG